VDVARRETQKPVPSVPERILASVVLHQTLAMIAAVVFDRQPGVGIVKVDSADKTSGGVTEIGLDLGEGQAGLNEEPSQSGFHR